MRNKTSNILFDYWNNVRDGRIAPQRIEIDPSELSKILSQTMILEVVEESSLAFRIAGTSICEFLGSEMRGQDFMGLWNNVDRRSLKTALNKTLSSGCPTRASISSRCRTGNTINSELLLLALYDHKGRLNRLLGCWSRENSPNSLGLKPRLSTVHHITTITNEWPENDAPALDTLDAPEHQPVVSTIFGDLRMRIVRRDRRQFGVLDGGLTD